jgi:Fe2+ transport system protein FeoA
MSKTNSAEVTLSERDRFWLKHHEAQVASGQSGKEYAAEKDLSLHALYQARKRLRAMGALPAARARLGEKRAGPGGPTRRVRFAKVAVAAPRVDASRLRIEFANGVALEGSGAAEADSIVELIERVRKLS